MAGEDKPTLKPGRLIADKYRVESVLGEGGMGIVFAATHVELSKRVAVKVLRPELIYDAVQSARFSREAHASAQLTGEHSVRVLDVGKLAEGAPFIVMEFLVGQDLGQLIQARGPLPFRQAVDFVLQACEGIAEAHARGFIHRDIKPQNLFLTQTADGSPLVKVLDFGLNKGLDNEKALTKSGSIFGSPFYMSPEQMKASRDVNERADIWALGVCLFELATGQAPFDAPTVAELVIKVLQEPPRDPRGIISEIPEGLSTAILKCLRKDSAMRFASVAALAEALEPFGSEESIGASTRVHKISEATRPQARSPGVMTFLPPLVEAKTRTAAAWDSNAKRELRNRRGATWGLLGGVVAAVLAVAFWPRPSAVPSQGSSSGDVSSVVPGAAKPLSLDPPAEPAATPAPPATTTATDADAGAAIALPWTHGHPRPSKPVPPKGTAPPPTASAPRAASKRSEDEHF